MNSEDETRYLSTLEHTLHDARRRATEIEDLERRIDAAMQAGRFVLPLEHLEHIQDAKEDVKQIIIPIESFFSETGRPLPDPDWDRPDWLGRPMN